MRFRVLAEWHAWPRFARQHAAVELVDHPRNVGVGLVIGRDTVVLVYCAGPGIVGGQRQRQVVVIAGQQRIQIGRAAANILVRLIAVFHAQVCWLSPASVASARGLRRGSRHGHCHRFRPSPRWPAGPRPGCAPCRRAPVSRRGLPALSLGIAAAWPAVRRWFAGGRRIGNRLDAGRFLGLETRCSRLRRRSGRGARGHRPGRDGRSAWSKPLRSVTGSAAAEWRQCRQ